VHNFRNKLGYASLVALASLILTFIMGILSNPSQSALATENIIVTGAKNKYLDYRYNYTFVHGTSLVFNAPQETGWTFDYIDVDFGCEVGGVVGSNVSSIFTVDHGRIQVCQRG
jgi:hypothetical protein